MGVPVVETGRCRKELQVLRPGVTGHRREWSVLPGLGWEWSERVCRGLWEVLWSASGSDGKLQEARLPCVLNRERVQGTESVKLQRTQYHDQRLPFLCV